MGDHPCPPSCLAGGCGGTPIEIIRHHIEQQQRPENNVKKYPPPADDNNVMPFNKTFLI
jgi:hypothetical protein